MDTSTARKSTFPAISLIVICLLWAGMILGISGLETPVKFFAPTLTRAVGLDVGRTVFHSFFLVQSALMLLVVLLACLSRARRVIWLLVSLLAVCLIIQMAWQIPALDARVTIVQMNQPLPPSLLHIYFSVTEGLKLMSLFWIGISGINYLSCSRKE